MKMQEIRQLSPKKLHELLEKTRRDLAVSRFHVKTGQSKDVASIRKQREMLAQIETLLKERVLFANAEKQ